MGAPLPTMGFVLVTGAGCVAALAYDRAGRPRVYGISKAVASLGFIGAALTAGAMGAVWSSLALGALVLSAAGDVALGVPGKKAFLVGLVSFAAAHSTYVAAFLIYGADRTVLAAAVVGAALFAVGTWSWLSRRVTGPMRKPVGAYVVIVSAMLAVGTAAGISHRVTLLVCGVLLVVGSDIAVARERFVTPGFANKLVGLPTYYLGQTLIAVSLSGS